MSIYFKEGEGQKVTISIDNEYRKDNDNPFGGQQGELIGIIASLGEEDNPNKYIVRVDGKLINFDPVNVKFEDVSKPTSS